MITSPRRAAVSAAAVTAVLVLPCAALASAGGPADRRDPTADPAPEAVATSAPLDVAADRLTDQTGLAVTIDALSPAALEPGSRLRLSGQVTNVRRASWRDAQVYLDIAYDPVTTKGALDDANSSDEPFGTRIVEFGLFDRIGAVPPGTTKSYRLDIPYAELPLSGAAGVHRVGVTVLATNRDGERVEAARTDTVMPLVAASDPTPPPAEVVIVVPVTAPIARHQSGNFLDERIAGAISAGGRLRNLVDLIEAFPPDTLEIVVDPALLDAVQDMSDGYAVTTRQEEADQGSGRNGTGQVEAEEWLADFQTVTARQNLLLMAWGSPDASALASQRMPGVVAAAVRASDEFAVDSGLITPTVSWQKNGASTRRGLVVSRIAGAVIQFVAADNLVNLRAQGESAYLPSLVTVPTEEGELTGVVTARELAGQRLTMSTSVLDFRQNLMAEATIRSLEAASVPSPMVVALPFGWNPGDAAEVDVAAAFDLATVEPVDLKAVTQSTPAAYPGPIRLTPAQSPLSDELTDAIVRLRTNGNTFTSLLTDNADAADFDRRLAVSATSLWLGQPQERLALIRMESRAAAEQLRKVTVTGPTFVALSSRSGRFPLTITNGLQESVTLRVDVRAQNPALRIDPIAELVLEPGQSRDIEVTTRSDSSGLTPVRVRLSTVDGKVFGAPWEFDVRATQIGIAIWVVMGAGSVILVGTVAFRLVRRIRTEGLHPREEPNP